MAGDWIKMRVWLQKDPRVITMADYLAGDRQFTGWLISPSQQTPDKSAYCHVTRNVITSLCVTGLLITWGTAREQGDRINEDLVLQHSMLDTLDALTELPSFGYAMQSIDWVREEQDRLVFPKYFKENESPDDRYKRQNAERQARHRELLNKRSNESNVTVTTEKRREEKRILKPKASAFALPDWVPLESWQGFVEMRTKSKSAFTERAKALLIAELFALVEAGGDPAKILDQSTANGWKGVFAVKANGGNGKSSGTPWWSSNEGIQAKAQELHIESRKGESWGDLKARVSAELEAHT